MASRASRRSGWVPLCVSALARAVLAVVTSLLLWSVAPAALGLHPTVVMTGSMLPRLVPGDVVLSRTVPDTERRLGQTLLFHDPDQRGHLRMHRWVATAPDGRLITRGDANPANDSTPVAPSAVVGVASLRVPFVARPVVWASEGRTTPIVVTAAVLAALLASACWFRAEDPDEDAASDDGSNGGSDGGADEGSDDAGPESGEESRSTPAGARRLVRSGVALLAVVGLGATHAATADAATAHFAATTANPTGAWAATPYFSCAGAARGADARFSWPLAERSGSVADDVTANGSNGTYSGGVTYRAAGPCAPDATTGVTLDGTSGRVTSAVAVALRSDITLQVWFRTTSTRGGSLMSVTSGTNTTMAVAMTTAGTITFGVDAGFLEPRVTSTARYRDGAWHLATAVAGGVGMVLYVDGRAVASSGLVLSAVAVRGNACAGYGDAGDLGTGSYDYFQGSLAYASMFWSSLPAATVEAQYAVASS